MIRLHLVGFTTDLKNLIFADHRGARGGGFVVSLDSRLKRALEEVARLEEEPDEVREVQARQAQRPERPAAEAREYREDAEDAGESEEDELEAPEPARPRVASKLTPKEIQALLRQGKSEEQVARLAGTDVEWVQRFSFAILAERAGVIEAVKSAQLTKPRLGPSSKSIGESVRANVEAKRLHMTPEEIDDAWRAVRNNGLWHVSFEYTSRGQKKVAEYSFDPASRTVEPLNEVAMDMGWRSDELGKPVGPKATASSPKVVSGVSARTARTANASQSKTKKRSARSTSSGAAAAGRPAPGSHPRAGAIRPEAPKARFEPGPEPGRPTGGTLPGLGSRIDVGEGEEDDEFIIRKPRSDPSEYSSLPKVWRPRRQP